MGTLKGETWLIISLLIQKCFLTSWLSARPFFAESFQLFKAQYNNQAQLCSTASVISNVQYGGNKLLGKMSPGAAVQKLLSFVKICVTDKRTIVKAYNSPFGDVEDAVQYYSAVADNSIDFFVTRNVKDFKHADEHLKVITPGEGVKILG
ncbi:MAG TPA: PIN domain-containing protein [Parafilimonas sp.]|nr:PIN domain-containing protein [Parafilimonas sp.]